MRINIKMHLILLSYFGCIKLRITNSFSSIDDSHIIPWHDTGR